MDNRSILDNELTEGLSLNSMSKDKLIRAANWAKFLAIMLYLSTVGMVYQFVQMTINTQYVKSRNHLEFGELVTVLTSIAAIVFTFFAAYNLWSFASCAITGIRKNNNKIFAISMESLKSYFKFYGFYMIIVAIFTFLLFYSLYLIYIDPRGF